MKNEKDLKNSGTAESSNTLDPENGGYLNLTFIIFFRSRSSAAFETLFLTFTLNVGKV